jgi:hypothetical protein
MSTLVYFQMSLVHIYSRIFLLSVINDPNLSHIENIKTEILQLICESMQSITFAANKLIKSLYTFWLFWINTLYANLTEKSQLWNTVHATNCNHFTSFLSLLSEKANFTNVIEQRCPTLSPYATCGDWQFKCGDKLNSLNFIFFGNFKDKV